MVIIYIYMSYKSKYLKYKTKYLQLKGGQNEYILLFISGNQNKIKEVSNILGDKYPFLLLDIDIEEIQSVSVEKVAKQKAIDSYKEFQKYKSNLFINDKKFLDLVNNQKIIVFCEDTGLGFEKMGSYKNDLFPGALIKFYYGSQKNGPKEKQIENANKTIISNIGGSYAESTTAVGVYIDGKQLYFSGSFEAEVVKNTNDYIQTEKGWDFDHILIPKKNNLNKKTVGQLLTDGDIIEKPREIAVQKFKEYLDINKIKISKLENFGSKKLIIN